ncbi:hypothetical protein AB0L10_45155, partial [Streptomyces flaveolus]|uniref:hypothetical protein n=1 Tax=Streptomyces flaveolus TaxID=67297 RepID=UPI003435F9F3
MDIFTVPRPVVTTVDETPAATDTAAGPSPRPSMLRLGLRKARRAEVVTPPPPAPHREIELRPYFTTLSQFSVKTVRL